jgi:HAD superfamily hydrolase (TIGR01509 family)
MIPKSMPRTPIRGGHRFSDKIMLHKEIAAAQIMTVEPSPAPDIRHLVFDVGKVLLHYDPHLAYRDLIPDLEERNAFLAEVCSDAWNVEQDRGRAWADAEADAIARHPDKADLIRAFRRRWHRMVPHARDDTVAIFRALIAAGHDVTILTNFAPDTFRETEARFPFLAESRGVTVSGHLGIIKPDPRIFEAHAAAFALEPAATLFFDDNPMNVQAARQVGWSAELYESAEGLRRDLARYGIAV